MLAEHKSGSCWDGETADRGVRVYGTPFLDIYVEAAVKQDALREKSVVEHQQQNRTRWRWSEEDLLAWRGITFEGLLEWHLNRSAS